MNAERDVVYFVKKSQTNEELVYSLRSVEKNFPHRNIWIYGGLPEGLVAPNHMRISQWGQTKWDKVRHMYSDMVKNTLISDDFYLFNDDFYVINPFDGNYVPKYRTTLPEHILLVEENYGDKPTEYTKLLRKAYKTLRNLDRSTLSYELHIPILLNKQKLNEIIKLFPDVHCTRTLYSNYYELGGDKMDDVKVYGNKKTDFDKDAIFLSTDDSAFKTNEELKNFLKERFPNKSSLEV